MADIVLKNIQGTETTYLDVETIKAPKVGGGLATFSEGGGGTEYTAGTGISITDDIISVDNTVYRNVATGTGSLIESHCKNTQDLTKPYVTVLGVDAKATDEYATALGYNSSASTYAVAIGKDASSNGYDGVAIGEDARSSGASTVAIGCTSKAVRDIGIAIGGGRGSDEGAAVFTEKSIAIGYKAKSGESGSGSTVANIISIGTQATAKSSKSTAIGNLAYTSAENSISIGYNAQATGYSAVSIGTATYASASSSVAIGNSAKARYGSSVAIGNSAEANAANAVQLGPGINSTASTLQYGDYTVIDTNGLVPVARLSYITPGNNQVLAYSSTESKTMWQSITSITPNATTSSLGLIQVGSGLSITDAGVLSADAQAPTYDVVNKELCF